MPNFPFRIRAAATLMLAAVFFIPVGFSQEPDEQIEPTDSVTTEKLSGAQWLLKMSQAIGQHNYQISLVEQRPGADTVPYLWRHGVFENGVSMEQLSMLNGPGKEFIRVNRQVSVFEPNVAPFSLTGRIIDGPFPTDLLLNPLDLQSAYTFIAIGRGRVSGRAAQQIRIVSRDNSRYAYQLWVDEEKGMPLKMNMLDQTGQLMKQIQVTQLTTSGEPHEFFSRINRAALPAITAVPLSYHQHNWQISYLPVGMSEVKRNTHRLSVTDQVVEYAMLSDGMVEVSVYVMPISASGPQNNVYRHESKTLLNRTEGNIQISVIGEIPPQTANKIATSLVSRVE